MTSLLKDLIMLVTHPCIFPCFSEFHNCLIQSAKSFPGTHFYPQIRRITQIPNQIVVVPQIPNSQIVNLQPKPKYHQTKYLATLISSFGFQLVCVSGSTFVLHIRVTVVKELNGTVHTVFLAPSVLVASHVMLLAILS